MGASQYRNELERKRKQRVDAEKKVAEYRKKEADKRTAAAKARSAAAKTNSESTTRMKFREAARNEDDANRAAKESAQWQAKVADYVKAEAGLQSKVSVAELSEAADADRKRKREQQRRDREAAHTQRSFEHRLQATEAVAADAQRQLRAPKPEKLRILMLGSSSEGDLRIGREQSRIKAAVQNALHRDLIELDVRTSATSHDLLDGVTRFRPHVVHFSGHSNEDVVVLERDVDTPHSGFAVSAASFGAAVKATDDPPLLIVLNSCHSASQINGLVEDVVPFAIGMSDEIGDGDAIVYATQFYAAIANGQSIASAHLSAQAALQLAGLPGQDLPTLACAADVHPDSAVLVVPPNA